VVLAESGRLTGQGGRKLVKTHVGPYRVEEMLGRGGMGVVYRGMHEHLGRQVAIKELAPELTQQPEFKDRFFAEARTQARLHHSNIVTVFDLIEEEREFFIVMEYVAGRTCDELLQESAGKGLALDEAARIFLQVLTALDYAHSEGVIHRDVKPSNVLLTNDGRVKLMDFGIALLIGDKRLTSSQASIGTPVYMSPEQILRPREMDHRTDIYSAAIVFYEMLAGRPPFDAESMYEISKLQIETPPPDLTSLNSAVPPSVAAVVAKALAKVPDERFASAGEMLRALREALPSSAATGAPPAGSDVSTRRAGSLQTTLPKGSAPPRPIGPQTSRPWRVLIPAAALLVSLAAGAGLYFKLSSTAPAPSVETVGAAGAMPAPVVSSPDSGAQATHGLEKGSESLSSPLKPADLGLEEPKALRDGAARHASSTDTGGAQRPEPVPPAPDSRAIDQETRRREVERVRAELQQGIEGVKAELAAQRFSAARDALGRLQETAVPYRADLIDEVASLRALEQETTSRQITATTAVLAQKQEEERLQERLREIRDLIADKRYPEAKTLASKLAVEAGVPEAVAAEARDLLAQADQEMKNIFRSTSVKTTDKVLKKPPQ
jgi:serine/threonine protein kinase